MPTKYIVNVAYTPRVSYTPKLMTIWLVLNDTNYGVGLLQDESKAVTDPVVVLIWTAEYVQQFESEQVNMGYSTIMEPEPI